MSFLSYLLRLFYRLPKYDSLDLIAAKNYKPMINYSLFEQNYNDEFDCYKMFSEKYPCIHLGNIICIDCEQYYTCDTRTERQLKMFNFIKNYKGLSNKYDNRTNH